MTSNPTTKTLSWTPPDFPPTTIDNDGVSQTFLRQTSNAKKEDPRQQVRCEEDLEHPTELHQCQQVSQSSLVCGLFIDMGHSLFILWFITTEDGKKYRLTTNAGLKGADLVGLFVSSNDLQELSGRGGTIIIPGSGSKDQLDVKSKAQNITGPADGDKWTNTRFSLDLAGINLEATLRPTGGNFYYAGSGGIQLFETGSSDPSPGWSWYWANPFTRIDGTLTIDGKPARINTAESFALFERQWGDFGIGKGYYALWAYLETGEVLISWAMEPGLDGIAKTAFASVWHPNGLHETIPVGPGSRASDVSTSERTGLKYHNEFFLDLPARDACFTFKKLIRDGEIIPALPEQRDKYITISESYSEGVARWNGKEVRFFGHIEQLSRLT